MMSNSTKLAVFNTLAEILDEHYHEFHGKVHSAEVLRIENGMATVNFNVGLNWLEEQRFQISFFVLTSPYHPQAVTLTKLSCTPEEVASIYECQLMNQLTTFGLIVEEMKVQPIAADKDKLSLSVQYESDSVMNRGVKTLTKETVMIQMPVYEQDYLLAKFLTVQ